MKTIRVCKADNPDVLPVAIEISETPPPYATPALEEKLYCDEANRIEHMLWGHLPIGIYEKLQEAMFMRRVKQKRGQA